MRLTVVSLLVVACLAAIAASASAAPARTCSPVTFRGHGYVVVAHGMRCTKARAWVLDRLRTGHHPRGYSCRKPSAGSNVRVHCIGSTKPAGDQAYRYFIGIRK